MQQVPSPKQFSITMDPALKDEIQAFGELHRRSLSALIEDCVRRAWPDVKAAVERIRAEERTEPPEKHSLGMRAASPRGRRAAR